MATSGSKLLNTVNVYKDRKTGKLNDRKDWCTCGRPSKSVIPCAHVMRAISENKLGEVKEDDLLLPLATLAAAKEFYAVGRGIVFSTSGHHADGARWQRPSWMYVKSMSAAARGAGARTSDGAGAGAGAGPAAAAAVPVPVPVSVPPPPPRPPSRRRKANRRIDSDGDAVLRQHYQEGQRVRVRQLAATPPASDPTQPPPAKKQRTCGYCRLPGHYRGTCKVRKRDEEARRRSEPATRGSLKPLSLVRLCPSR